MTKVDRSRLRRVLGGVPLRRSWTRADAVTTVVGALVESGAGRWVDAVRDTNAVLGALRWPGRVAVTLADAEPLAAIRAGLSDALDLLDRCEKALAMVRDMYDDRYVVAGCTCDFCVTLNSCRAVLADLEDSGTGG